MADEQVINEAIVLALQHANQTHIRKIDHKYCSEIFFSPGPLLTTRVAIETFVKRIFHHAIYKYHDIGCMELYMDLIVFVTSRYSPQAYQSVCRELINCCGQCASTRYKTSMQKDPDEFLARNLGEIMLVSVMFKRKILSTTMLSHIITRRLFKEFTGFDVEGQRMDVKSVALLLLCAGEYFDLEEKKLASNTTFSMFLVEDQLRMDKYYSRLETIANGEITEEEDNLMFRFDDNDEIEVITAVDNGKVANRELRTLIRSVLKVRKSGWGLNSYQLQSFIDEKFLGVLPCDKSFRWFTRILNPTTSMITDDSPFTDCTIYAVDE